MKLLRALFPAPLSGFGTAGIRRQSECGAIVVIGGAPWEDAQRGVEEDEDALGINVSRFVCRYYLAVNEKLMSNVGEPRARAMSDQFSRDVTIEGEVIGPITIAIATAVAVANDVDTVGDGSGDLLLDELTETQERSGWRSMTISLSSDPGVTV